MSDSSQKSAAPKEAWQAQAARLALLSEVVLLIAKTPDLDRLLSGAINKLKWVIDFERCTLGLVNSEGTAYQLRTLMETRRGFPKSRDKPPVSDDALEGGSIRSVLSLPLAAYNKVLGAITFGSTRGNAFTEDDTKIAQSFAVHLALAIDRWRQSQELEARNREVTEALEQQTATGEVLRVISSSPTDVQPVFDMIARSAKQLCRGQFSWVCQFDGELIHLVSHHGLTPEGVEAYRQVYPRPPGRESAIERAILDRAVAHIPDVQADPDYGLTALAQAITAKSIVAVPMLREGNPIGGIVVSRSVAGPFPDKQIELLKTFAEQAVIAIENVRLFQELARSLEELKALGEVGQAISSTLDLQTVLATIVARAVELSKTDAGTIYEFDEAEQVFEPRANYGMSDELVEALRGSRLRIGDGTVGQAAAQRAPVQVPDIENQPTHRLHDLHKQTGFRALLAVPLLREERIIGGLVVRRKAPGEFPQDVLDLLQTFATQSAPRRVPSRRPRPASDLCDPVGARHPERAAVPRDRREESTTHGREPA
jgi:GAF domain-containing protein